jgi:hypothetical protein
MRRLKFKIVICGNYNGSPSRDYTVAPLEWLRRYSKNWEVAGSNPDEITGFFSQYTQSFRPHYGPGVDSASNRNEYQQSFWGGGVKRGRRVRLTTSPSVSQFSGKCGSLDILQPYRLPRTVTGITLLYLSKGISFHVMFLRTVKLSAEGGCQFVPTSPTSVVRCHSCCSPTESRSS